MIRHLDDIPTSKTSHSAGLKQVLLAANESGCSITQIAVMHYGAGEIASSTIHPDLQDNFYILSGEVDVILDGENCHCKAKDFILVPFNTSCELHAITDVEMLAVGCVIEAERKKLYPMLFDPNLHEAIWGGSRLKEWKKLNCNESAPDCIHVGESWEVSAVPSSPSIVSNGTWAGYTLPEVIARRPEAILGKSVAKKYNNRLPLLIKFIDAQSDLSIQVHPNDEMSRHEHNKMGKTEMWYVLDAKPGAYIYAGFSKEITPEEYKERVSNGTICEVLAKHEVNKRDVFYLPAGRVHAICSGILLVEVQQSSDITYRIFDYNRLGFDGQPRELHSELAAKALNFEVLDNYRTSYIEQANRPNVVVDSPYFSVCILDLTAKTSGEACRTIYRNMIKYDSFVIVICLRGCTMIRIRRTKDEISLNEGYSCLIPAAIAEYEYIVTEAERCEVIESYINNKEEGLGSKISRFFHIIKNG